MEKDLTVPAIVGLLTFGGIMAAGAWMGWNPTAVWIAALFWGFVILAMLNE